MESINPKDIKKELKEKYLLKSETYIQCYYCVNWGLNRKLAVNSMFESKCIDKKQYIAGNCFCRHFQPDIINFLDICY